MDELFDIVGYEGRYKINKNGDVWSCKTNRFMSVFKDDDYYCVRVGKKKYYLHKLLGLQFIPNPYNLPVIDHIDRNSENNCIENLRWSSHNTNNQNRGKPKTNTSGYKNICLITYPSGKQSWRIQIQSNFNIYLQFYKKNEYTLEAVVAFRNEKLLELGLEITD
jgi:hypothetical protein